MSIGLGAEGLTRFVTQQPLYRVHECVLGVLALEGEPVDRDFEASWGCRSPSAIG